MGASDGGLKDAMEPLTRAKVSFQAVSDAGTFKVSPAKDEEGIIEVISTPRAESTPTTGRTIVTLEGADVPAQSEVMFIRDGLEDIAPQQSNVMVFRKRASEGNGLTVWVRGVYRFDQELQLPGNYHFVIKDLTPKMQVALGRDRRNASTEALRPFIKDGYAAIRDKGMPCPQEFHQPTRQRNDQRRRR